MPQKNIRIKDIALLAGVSEGTVDRVLHKRGRVSKAAAEKVNKVLKEINYRPNLLAKTLGQNRTYRIATLTPNPDLDPFWKQSQDGIVAGEKQLAQFGIQVVIESAFYNPAIKESFQEAALKVFHSFPDGVLIAPLFYYASLPFFKRLNEVKIPYILFNTRIAEAKPLTFIGQDLIQSGRLAADLLRVGQTLPAAFAVLHVDEDLSNSVHLREKENGFREHLKKKDPFSQVYSFELKNANTAAFRKELNLVLNIDNLRGVFVSTSKGYAVAPSVKKINPEIRVVGYDLIKVNLECLEAGTIDFLINQNPMRQAKLGIQSLANCLLFNKTVPAQHLFPLEIITAQNVGSYLSHPGNQAGILV